MSSYHQLSLIERAQIKALKLQGISLRGIGRAIGRDHSVISRELKRNHQGHPSMSGYVPELADHLAKKRKKEASSRPRLKSKAIRDFVHDKLEMKWSPEQIAGVVGAYINRASISHEAIYQYIYSEHRDGIALLARSHKQRYSRKFLRKRRCPSIKNRIDIEDRPEAINNREVFGHWESDSIVSQSGKSAINVIYERMSRKVFINKLANKTSEATKTAIIGSLSKVSQRARMSITYDNGSENYYHEKINHQLKMQSYFCKPYRSWEKGGVENTNGLIRRYIPKRTNLDDISEDMLKDIEAAINNRPRKCLNFKTAEEVFMSLC